MERPSAILGLLLVVPTLAACATPYGQGRAALRQERYDEAASHFSESLASDPGRLDARAGLGMARYKLGALDEAADALQQVVARAPRHTGARLYLGLTHLLKGEDGPAAEQLTALRDLKPHPRIVAQIDRALELIRSGQLTEPLRRFVAASLEDEVQWQREVREAERSQWRYAEPWPYWYPYWWYPYRYPYRYRWR